MVNIHTDSAKNRLYITLGGLLSAEETRAAVERVKAGIAALQPGFTIINDIAGFHPVSPEATAEILLMQHAIKQAGVGHMVRVVGPTVLAVMQFERASQAAGNVVDAVATLADAETLLEFNIGPYTATLAAD